MMTETSQVMSTGATPAVGQGARRVAALLRAIDAENTVESLVTAMGDAVDDEDAVQRGRDALWQAIRQLDARRLRLQQAVEQLDDLGLSLLYERQFGDTTWEGRRSRLDSLLQADAPAGVRAWVQAWAAALLVGRYDEADRLLSAELPISAAFGWLAERLMGALDAMRTALTEADEPEWLAQGLRRSEVFLRFLADGATLDGVPALADRERIEAALLLAQWKAAAGQDASAELALAERLGASAAELLVIRAIAATSKEERARLAREALAADNDLIVAVVVLAQSANDDTGTECSRVVANLAHLEGLIPYLNGLPVPVSASVWLALARRGADEDHPSAMAFLDRMEQAAPNLSTRGEGREIRAELRQREGAPADEVADILDSAATDLISVDAVRARELYERALVLVPHHENAALGLADAIRLTSWRRSLDQTRAELERAVDLVTLTHARNGVRQDTAWSLLVEAGLRRMLADDMAETSRLQAWKGLAAAARALVFQPPAPSAWVTLASMLSEVGAFRAAAAFANIALDLDPSSDAARDEWLKAVAIIEGSSATKARLDLMPEDELAPWHLGVRAYILLVDDPAAAYRDAGTAVRGENTNPWLRWLLATAATMAGHEEEAETHWRWLWRETPRETASNVFYVAAAAIELGYQHDARELCERIIRERGMDADLSLVRATSGIARLVGGDPGGLDDIITAILESPTPRYLVDHRAWTLGHLPRLARRYGVEVPDLAPAYQALARRAADLPVLEPDIEILELGRRVADTATSDGETALAAAAWNASRSAAAQFRMHMGRPADAAVLLRELVLSEPDVDEHRMALATAELEVQRQAEQKSEDRRQQRLFVDGVGEAVDEPSSAEAEDERPVELVLPAAWFAGIEDPVRSHEVLNRHLPDLRARLARRGITLPTVMVRAEEAFDAGMYQVTIDGAVVAHGAVDERIWVCPAPWVACLPPELRAQMPPATDGTTPVAFVAPTEPSPLVQLVAWSPAESVVRALEAAAVDRFAS